MLQIKTILHPTTFSESAMQAIRLAHSLARDHGARLVLLSVTPPFLPNPEVYVTVIDINDRVEKDRRQLATLAQTITDVPLEYHARNGEPGPAIVLVAEQIQADLIVMGTHGRTGMSRILMGSIAEHVLRHAHYPVLTVKPGKFERLPSDEKIAEKAGSDATECDAAML